MTPDEITRLYDDRYAANYDQTYLEAPHHRGDAQDEVEFIRALIHPNLPWLDVACGTGYFLACFPTLDRVGLDLSPAMLRMARRANSAIELREHDFRKPLPEYENRFGLVSCMWFAYGLVDSMRELATLVANLASWTAPAGNCFVPINDPAYLVRKPLPYRVEPPDPDGTIVITGVLWSFIEADGSKTHTHQVAPKLEVMVEMFQVHFEDVRIERYSSGRPALIASGKRQSGGCQASDDELRSL